MGGLNWVDGDPNGWANVDEAEISKAINAALEAGVNHFDNADVYGNGRAERMLARILGKRSKDVVIASKMGHYRGTLEHAYDPLNIRHQCEVSLKNLNREAIDLYYFHHGDFGEKGEFLHDAAKTIQALKKEGKIRAIGQSAYSEEDFLKCVPVVQPDVLQSWASANDDHFIRAGSPVRKLMDERKLSFVAFSPLDQGLLLGKYKPGTLPNFEPGDHRRGNDKFSDANIKDMNARVDKLKAKFGGETKDLARVALQYLLAEPVVACVIPGFRNLRQVEVNLAGADQPLAPGEVSFVREVFAGMN
jgi:aryl-alcohol dehydrogenase-like predicted oxidoreductase